MGRGDGRNMEKARVALRAMRELGFGKKPATAALKRLLNLFDHKWELIEAESYRALADAILDDQQQTLLLHDQQQPNAGGPAPANEQQQQANGNRNHGAVSHGDGQGQDTMPQIQAPFNQTTTTTPPQSSSSRTHFRASAPPSPSTTPTPTPTPTPGGAQTTPTTTTLFTNTKQMMDAEFQHPAFILKHPKPEPPEPVDMDAPACLNVQPGLILRSRNRNLNASSSEFNALPLPDRNPHHISADKNRRALQHHSRNTNMSHVSVEPTSSTPINGTGGSQVQEEEAPSLEIDVASSPGGEVKLSLKCSSAADPSKLNMPHLEAVYKMVEDKYLSSDKLPLPPDFSIPGLMAEICQGVVQLGSTSKHFESGGPAKHLALSKTTHDINDISKGQENLKIPIANKSGRGKYPPSFSYLPGNEVFQNAMVNISLAQIDAQDCCPDCFDDCLSAPVPCACARGTGGEYAYTLGGLLKPEFIDECVSMNRFPEVHHKVNCKTCPLERSRDKASPEHCRGHLVRKFIKECWSKCGCSMRCGNRVVQRGIRFNLEVFSTGDGRGWGLRTQNALPKGAFVCEYAGEILTCAEVHERAVENMKNARYTHTVVLDAGWPSGGSLKDEEALCLDGTFYGNIGRFINHRCLDANLAMVPVQVETPDRHYYHVAFFTSRKVEALEELTWDYGIDFDEELGPVKVFECLCESKYCRGGQHPRNGNGNGKKRCRGVARKGVDSMIG